MRVVVIGGSGHIGTYLVPRLVEAGYEVVSVSRGQREAYQSHGAWSHVQKLVMDRAEGEKTGGFGKSIVGLKPDVVVDLICFKLDSARHLVEALKGRVQHYLCAGTIWVHGAAVKVPATEDQPRRPFGEYGIEKANIEAYLLREARFAGFPATVLHPGHITGPGWVCINPAGNFDPKVYEELARGDDVALPNLGMETVHHVHADDVAQGFMKAIFSWRTSVGENFHVVSPEALTLRGFAESVAAWFGKPANLRYLPWEEWKKTVRDPSYARSTWDHIAHSDNYSIEKARRLIGYQPRYSTLEAVHECVQWLIEHKVIDVSR